jgi:hypothetical protein
VSVANRKTGECAQKVELEREVTFRMRMVQQIAHIYTSSVKERIQRKRFMAERRNNGVTQQSHSFVFNTCNSFVSHVNQLRRVF